MKKSTNKQTMNILIFGNPLLKIDNTPVKLIPDLQKAFPNHTFLHIDPTENLEQYGPSLTIIDTIQDIKQVKILKLQTLKDFQHIILPNSLSMHDFDLSLNLRLLKKLGHIKTATIIGIPMKIPKQKALKEITNILQTTD